MDNKQLFHARKSNQGTPHMHASPMHNARACVSHMLPPACRESKAGLYEQLNYEAIT